MPTESVRDASEEVHSARLLVVDDEPAVTEMLAAYLGAQGWQTRTVGTGEEALDLLRRQHMDLVLLDVHLPGIDGFTTLVRLQEMGVVAPVIMISTSPGDEDQLHALGLDARDYLTKPFDPDELTHRIRELLAPGERATRPLSREVHLGRARIDLKRSLLWRDGEQVALSDVQTKLLETMLGHRGVAVSRKRLLREAMEIGPEQVDFALTLRTFSYLVDEHMERLQELIEPDPAHPVLLKRVFGQGYRLATPDS